MQIQYCAAIPSQGQSKPSLVIRSIADNKITDVVPGPNGLAIVMRASVGLSGMSSDVQTWETVQAILERMANAPIGAVAVLVSEEDLAAAQSAHDANP